MKTNRPKLGKSYFIKEVYFRIYDSGTRDVNVLIFLDFSFRYDSVHQKYKRLKRYVTHYVILLHRVTLRNEFSALEYLIQR